MKTLEQRFWEKVDKGGDCWKWIAYKNSWGYGQFGIDGSLKLAHRVAYELCVGEIPEGMCVLHTCDNPGCVNPDHLWLGTNKDNTQDMIMKGRQAKEQPKLRGEKNGSAKLTREKVNNIRIISLFDTPQKEIAKAFGITQQQVSNIINKKSWA